MANIKYNVTVIVDEETLRDAADAEPEETTDGVLAREFGWLNASGVIVSNIERIPESICDPEPRIEPREKGCDGQLDNDCNVIGEGFGGI